MEFRCEERNLEGLAPHLIDALDGDAEGAADQELQLPHVQLGYDHPIEPVQDFPEVARKRVYVIEMEMAELEAGLDGFLHGRGNGSIGATPTDDQGVAVRVAHNLGRGNVVGYACDFGMTLIRHHLMVFGVV